MFLALPPARFSTHLILRQLGGVIDDHSLKEGFALVHEAFVFGAVFLVKLMFLHGLEVQAQTVAEAVIRDRADFCRGRFAN